MAKTKIGINMTLIFIQYSFSGYFSSFLGCF